MPKKQPTWFCPTSNVGFHKIFCTEGNDALVLQLLNSIIDDRKVVVTKVGLFTEEDHVLVNDKFLQIFVELPKLGVERGEDGAGMQFLRALRDIGKTDERPDEYKDPALDRLFHASMYKHFNKEEQMKYDKEMEWPEDYIDNARNMVLDAVEETSREVARKMKADGLESSLIAKYSGLTAEEVGAL